MKDYGDSQNLFASDVLLLTKSRPAPAQRKYLIAQGKNNKLCVQHSIREPRGGTEATTHKHNILTAHALTHTHTHRHTHTHTHTLTHTHKHTLTHTHTPARMALARKRRKKPTHALFSRLFSHLFSHFFSQLLSCFPKETACLESPTPRVSCYPLENIVSGGERIFFVSRMPMHKTQWIHKADKHVLNTQRHIKQAKTYLKGKDTSGRQ